MLRCKPIHANPMTDAERKQLVIDTFHATTSRGLVLNDAVAAVYAAWNATFVPAAPQSRPILILGCGHHALFDCDRIPELDHTHDDAVCVDQDKRVCPDLVLDLQDASSVDVALPADSYKVVVFEGLPGDVYSRHLMKRAFDAVQSGGYLVVSRAAEKDCNATVEELLAEAACGAGFQIVDEVEGFEDSSFREYLQDTWTVIARRA